MGKSKMKITFKKLRKELGEENNLKLMKLLGLSQDEPKYEKWLKERNKGLGSIQSQKKGHLDKKWKEPIKFRVWYFKKYIKQSGLCEYCKVPQELIRDIYTRQNGWREGKNTQDNKKGTRGWSLEIDREKPKGKYTPKNCVLACYPCNNAKSDVFNPDEFEIIRKAIQAVWVKKAKAKGLLKEIFEKYPSLKKELK